MAKEDKKQTLTESLEGKTVTPPAPEPAKPLLQFALDAICYCGERLARERSKGEKAEYSCLKFFTGKPTEHCQKDLPAKDENGCTHIRSEDEPRKPKKSYLVNR
jgi:hypothetical protein